MYELPLLPSDQGPTYASLFTGQSRVFQPWSTTTLSQLLQFSLAISTWKQYGSSRWSLRCNPSSGNLHPTETYLILVGMPGLDDGLYHYRADRHALELRCQYRSGSGLNGPMLLCGFSSVHWREAWKYGERAYRYCQLDLGHALAALDFAAATLGCRATPLVEIGSDALFKLLGLDRQDDFHSDEVEHGDLLACIHPISETPDIAMAPLLKTTAEGEWHGHANKLDQRHLYDWPIIAEVSEATRRPAGIKQTNDAAAWPVPTPAADHANSRLSALEIFLRRRSAQAFDPAGVMQTEDFFRLMDRLLPRSGFPPWNAQTWQPKIHLILFIHKVHGLQPGIYFLARRHTMVEKLKRLMRDDWLWKPVPVAPPHLPFYCLARTDAKQAAMHLGCHQDIAGDSSFSLSMLAEFESVSDFPWRYNELYWEAGMIGQSLYLEAEAIGMRGTGIGCFFDDAVHDMLGIMEKSLQAIYHFTVGLPLVDSRLASLPPYPSRQD